MALRIQEEAADIVACLDALEQHGPARYLDGRQSLFGIISKPSTRQGILDGVTTGAGEGLAGKSPAERAADETAEAEKHARMMKFVQEADADAANRRRR